MLLQDELAYEMKHSKKTSRRCSQGLARVQWPLCLPVQCGCVEVMGAGVFNHVGDDGSESGVHSFLVGGEPDVGQERFSVSPENNPATNRRMMNHSVTFSTDLSVQLKNPYNI